MMANWDYVARVLEGSDDATGYYGSVRSSLHGEATWEPVAGQRVAFTASGDALLGYGQDMPDRGSQGVVVTLRTASGDMGVSQEGYVFVRWASSGRASLVRQEHLRLVPSGSRTAQAPSKLRVASLGDLTEFFTKVADSTLVHKATRDLWSLKKDGTDFVIERLFDAEGDPLKV